MGLVPNPAPYTYAFKTKLLMAYLLLSYNRNKLSNLFQIDNTTRFRHSLSKRHSLKDFESAAFSFFFVETAPNPRGRVINHPLSTGLARVNTFLTSIHWRRTTIDSASCSLIVSH